METNTSICKSTSKGTFMNQQKNELITKLVCRSKATLLKSSAKQHLMHYYARNHFQL